MAPSGLLLRSATADPVSVFGIQCKNHVCLVVSVGIGLKNNWYWNSFEGTVESQLSVKIHEGLINRYL